MNIREPIPTKDDFRVASRPETIFRRWRAQILARWSRIAQGYKKIVPPYHRRKVRLSALTLILSAAVGWQIFAHNPAPLTVYFYDIGQGDGIHLRTAEGFDVLIDGGPSARVVEKLGRTMPFWDKTIELMILTHPHADHMVGQIAVLKRFKVERMLYTGVMHTTDEYLEWINEIQNKRVPMEMVRAGQEWLLGREAGGGDSTIQGSSSAPSQFWVGKGKLRREAADAPKMVLPHRPPPFLTILYPKEDYEGKRVSGSGAEGDGLNDTSIVTRLDFGEVSFLFTGDAEQEVEKVLLGACHQQSVILSEPQGEREISHSITKKDESSLTDLPAQAGAQDDNVCGLQSTILKVAHHGSKSSTSKEFLQAVQPNYAVIQSGRKNRFGHPHFPVLWRLKQAGAEILRNDRDGDIVFETNGTALHYEIKGVE